MIAPAAEVAPFYATQITRRDVDGLLAFLRAQTAAALAGCKVGTPERRCVRAVELAVNSLERKIASVMEVDDGSDDVAQAKHPLWTELIHIAQAWNDALDFDASRWRHTDWVSPAQHQSNLAYRRRQLAR